MVSLAHSAWGGATLALNSTPGHDYNLKNHSCPAELLIYFLIWANARNCEQDIVGFLPIVFANAA